MFDNLVTYHIHRRNLLPANDALVYQYILAGNGVFIRAETGFFAALLSIAPGAVRGLPSLQQQFRLKIPRVSARLLDAALADARRARQPNGKLNESLYQFHYRDQAVQVKKPPQSVTGVSVTAVARHAPTLFCDLHSHGNMRAFWSGTDDADEQGALLYAVIGKVDNAPEIRLRVGVYGYWMSLPVTAVFDGDGGFIDLHNKPKKEKSP